MNLETLLLLLVAVIALLIIATLVYGVVTGRIEIAFERYVIDEQGHLVETDKEFE